jgi:uncharacterized membrane protein
MLITLLMIYGLSLTLYLLRIQRMQNKQTELDKIWKEITAKPNPGLEDLKVIAEVAKVRQTEIPWYERSLSTIGLVAFFSMLIATSFQTINSAKTEIESSNLRQEIKGLESQRAGWNKLVKNLSEVIVLKQMNSGKLEESEKDILKQRISDLEQTNSKTKEDEIEQLKIYLALKQFDNASALVEKSEVLVNDASPENLLLLAEASFLDGAKNRAKFLLSKFEPNISKQPQEWQVRFFVIRAALDPNPGNYAKDVAAIKGISLSEADELIANRVDGLKQEARRRAAASNGAEGENGSR